MTLQYNVPNPVIIPYTLPSGNSADNVDALDYKKILKNEQAPVAYNVDEDFPEFQRKLHLTS